MFHHSARSIKYNWKIIKSKTRLEYSNLEVPKLSVQNDNLGIIINCHPVEMFYEPCIVDNNHCAIEFIFNKEIPEDFIKLFNDIYYDIFLLNKKIPIKLSNDIYFDRVNHKLTKYSTMHDPKTNGLDIILNLAQEYFIRKIKIGQEEVQIAFDELRKFCKLPPIVLDISDEKMARSDFGQASHTAKQHKS